MDNYYNTELIQLKQKTELYLIKLEDISSKIIREYFIELYRETKKNCKNKNNILKEYQNNLRKIKDLEDFKKEQILNKFKDKFENYEKLVKYIFQNYFILNKINQISLPKTSDYIHEVYLNVARILYKNPYLVYDIGIKSKDVAYNMGIIDKIITKQIKETIIKLLPINSLEDYNDDIDDKSLDNIFEEDESENENELKEENEIENTFLNENGNENGNETRNEDDLKEENKIHEISLDENKININNSKNTDEKNEIKDVYEIKEIDKNLETESETESEILSDTETDNTESYNTESDNYNILQSNIHEYNYSSDTEDLNSVSDEENEIIYHKNNINNIEETENSLKNNEYKIINLDVKKDNNIIDDTNLNKFNENTKTVIIDENIHNKKKKKYIDYDMKKHMIKKKMLEKYNESDSFF